MTSFNDFETSVESSRPIELYLIAQGSTTYRYTSAEDDITIGSDVFTATSISRGRIEQGADAKGRTLTLTVPRGDAFASQYVNIVPGERATLQIFRYQRDETPAFDTQILLFEGIVNSVRFPNDGYTAEIALRSTESALNRVVPRFSYMGMCNHFLYDEGCKASPSSFDHTGEVTAAVGTVITVTGAAASTFDFVGGYCRPTSVNDYRMILAQSGDDLTLLLPFFENPVGSNMQAFAGCDHIVTGDCALVFDNVANFGGFGFVPNRNPFQTGL